MAIYMQYKMQKASSQIYGASWDGSSSTRWTRTDAATLLADPNPAVNNGSGSSPFDYIMPWAGMVRVSDPDAGELVAIPKFYFKLGYANETSPRGLKIQISSKPFDGSQISPAHMDRGDGKGERDVVYVGRYQCASDYKSKTGVKPVASKTRAEFRSGIHGLGNSIWQWDYAMLKTIQLLYLVEYADWDSQTKIGYGCGDGSDFVNMGVTDNMVYNTGTDQSTRTDYGNIQYRNIEGLWSNALTFCDGIYLSSGKVYIIKNPSEFSDNSNGIDSGINNYLSSYNIVDNEISQITGLTWLFVPSQTQNNPSFNNYITDLAVINSNSNILYTGGSYGQSLGRGLFYFGSAGASTSTVQIGSRLMKLP